MFDFVGSEVWSLFEKKNYKITMVENLTELKTELDLSVGFDVATAVVQYTADQYGAGADQRIVCHDTDGAQNGKLLLSEISSSLNTELTAAKAKVEEDISA